MTAPTVIERFASRKTKATAKDQSAELLFSAIGFTQSEYATAAIRSVAPGAVAGAYGFLVLNSISVEQVGYDQWDGVAGYVNPENKEEKPDPEQNPDLIEINFDTSGGTQHITQAIEQLDYGPVSAPGIRMAGVIGLKGEDVEGVDIVVPKLEFSLTKRVKRSKILAGGFAYVKTLASITGKTNDASFIGFADGELLFLGVQGGPKGQGLEGDYELQFRFSASSNVDSQKIGTTITIRNKKGHDYVWVKYKADSQDNRFIQVPDVAFVAKVYESTDFGKLEMFR